MKQRLIPAVAALALASPAFADMDAARALVAQYSQLPTFEAPGPAFDAQACMADKKMFVIPLTNANPFNAAISQGFVDAAAMVGFELRDWETQMDPAGWIQGINTAVAEGYDLIDCKAACRQSSWCRRLARRRAQASRLPQPITGTHQRKLRRTSWMVPRTRTMSPSARLSRPDYCPDRRQGERSGAWPG